MTHPRARFGNRAPSKAANRTALQSMLAIRRHSKPPTDADFASYERCYGVKEADARAMWRDLLEARR